MAALGALARERADVPGWTATRGNGRQASGHGAGGHDGLIVEPRESPRIDNRCQGDDGRAVDGDLAELRGGDEGNPTAVG